MRAVSFDYLVGGGEELRVEFEAEGFCRLHVDGEIELRRLHYRQVGRLRALENLGHVNADLAVGVRGAGSVAHQSACGDELTPIEHRRNLIARREVDELLDPAAEQRLR